MITEEAIPDPDMDAIPADERAELDEMMRRTLHGEDAGEAEAWVAACRRYPHIPIFRNMLFVSLMAAGRESDAIREATITFETFPDYLFGIANHCGNLIMQNKLEEAGRVIDDKFMLDMRFPNRQVFHLTEVVAYQGMIARYFLATGQQDAAEGQISLLTSIAPDHPTVKELRRAGELFGLSRLLERAISAFDRFRKQNVAG